LDKFDLDEKSEKELTIMIKKISKIINQNEEKRIRVFEIAEEYGMHITPVHFYQPIPDTRNIPKDLFDKFLHYNEICLREEEQIQLLTKLGKYSSELEGIPKKRPENVKEYFYENRMFGPMDAAIYYSIIREFNPKTIIEVGSGFSTLIASKAATKNKTTSIISIEPYPRKFLLTGVPHLEKLIQKPVQNLDVDKFKILEKNDILFIDTSHVSKINSDVNHLLLHVIPELNSGVLIHIHDIFFPYEYPRGWLLKKKRFWNELYLVWAFLIGNSKYEILLLNHFLNRNHQPEVEKCFPMLKENISSGSLWMQKK